MLNRLSFILAIPACNALCVLPPLADHAHPEYRAPLAPHAVARGSIKPPETQDLPIVSAMLGTPTEAPIASALPFIDTAQDDVTSLRSLDCLTAAVYYEARSEPVEGQRAVAQVVLNRVRHPGFPNSVCGVVYQGSERSTGCQFTFTCDGSMTLRREPGAWSRAQQVAQQALDGSVDPEVGLATSYHADSIIPWWARSLNKVATIGSQIFYSLRGALGDALSFKQSYAGAEPEPNPIAVAERPVTLSLPSRYTFATGASVAVHRGSDGAAAVLGEAASFGVRVHVANRSDSPVRREVAVSTVKVHRGGTSEAPDPT